MAVFSPAFSITQSGDGKLLTITDNSNWGAGNNDQNYERANFVRTFVLKDAYEVVLATLILPTNSNVVTYEMTKNLWIVTTYTAVGVVNYSLIQKELFDRLMAIAYRNAINSESCCSNQRGLSNINMASLFLTGVDFAIPIGNGVDVQKFEDTAYSYIS